MMGQLMKPKKTEITGMNPSSYFQTNITYMFASSKKIKNHVIHMTSLMMKAFKIFIQKYSDFREQW